MLVVCLFLSALSEKLIEYRLSTNYGELVYDHSGNGMNAKVRDNLGLKPLTIFTDRGFYIGSRTSIAPISQGKIQIPNPGTYIIWSCIDSSAGRAFHMVKPENKLYHLRVYKGSSNNYIIKYFTNIEFIRTLSADTFPSGNYQIDQWVLISISISNTQYIFKQNGLTLEIIDFGSYINYDYWFVIGWDSIGLPIKGFIWYYVLINYENAEVDFIGSNYETCFIETCSTCNTFIFIDYLNKSGCISVQQDTSTDGKGNSCQTAYPCRDDKAINCLCESKSCSYESIDKVWCIDIETNEFLRSSALCEDEGQGCCMDICKECSNMTACITCLETNAFVDEDGLCSCKEGYYGNRPLNYTGSCIKCADECLKCDNITTCSICIDQNAFPASNGCICEDGFWPAGNSSEVDNCKICKNECKTCGNNYSCIECDTEGTFYIDGQGCCLDICTECSNETNCIKCLADNAFVDIDGLCTCEDGYFGSRPLNSTDSCKLCADGCLQCDNSSICITCMDQNAYPTINGCICKDGFWSSGNKSLEDNCKPCKSECKTCFNDSSCIECKLENSVFESGKCECKNGFTLKSYNNEDVCSDKCFDGCSVCESGECKNCLDINAIVSNDQCKCKIGFFKNNSEESLEQVCLKCSYGCISCTHSFNCELCDDLFILNNTACICKSGYYIQNSVHNENEYASCLKCQDPCEECFDYNKCTSCRKSFILNKDKCVCMTGYTQHESTCKQNYFECLQSVSKNNIIKLNFNESLTNPLKFSDFNLTLKNSTSIKFKLHKSSKKMSILIPYFPGKISKNTTIIVQISTNPIYSTKKSLLREYFYEVLINEIKSENNSTEITILKDSTYAALAISASSGFLVNFLLVWNLLNTLDIINYIPLTHNEITPEIRKICSDISIINPIPNVPELFMNKKSSSILSKEIQDCQIDYSPFIVNSGKELLILAFFLALFPFLCLTYYILKLFYQPISKKVLKIIKNYRYNFFIRFFLQVYLNFGVYALVQIKYDKLGSPIEYYINQITAFIFLILFSIAPWFIMILLCVYQAELEVRDHIIIEKYGTLFNELKTEMGLRYSIFWVLFTLRRAQYLLTQFFMNFNYIAQMSLNLGTTLLLIVYYFVFKPLRNRIDFFNLIISEICIGLCLSLVLLLNFFESEQAKFIINSVFVNTIIFYLGFQSLIGLFTFFSGLRKIWLIYEKKLALKFINKASSISLGK